MAGPSDFIVFADESGDHGLERINADYPIFVLSCCVFSKEEYVGIVCPELQRFKLRWWPHDAVVLHTSQIKRQEPPFTFLKSQEKRTAFMDDLTKAIAACPFTLIAGVIHKQRLADHYKYPENPYSLALQFCMERVCGFLAGSRPTRCRNHLSRGEARAARGRGPRAGVSTRVRRQQPVGEASYLQR